MKLILFIGFSVVALLVMGLSINGRFSDWLQLISGLIAGGAVVSSEIKRQKEEMKKVEEDRQKAEAEEPSQQSQDRKEVEKWLDTWP